MRLLKLKNDLVAARATPPLALRADLKGFDLRALGTKFDVILVDPPWREYARRAVSCPLPFWNYEEIEGLNIEDISKLPVAIISLCML